MTFYNTFVRRQNLGVVAVILGVIGLAFFWWAPVGMVLALAGLIVGLVGWTRVQREASSHIWLGAGIVLSAAAQAQAIWAAAVGDVPVQLRAYY
jgi:hypothetical protein